MKIKNITDVEGFFKVVDSCAGKVELFDGRRGSFESEIKAVPVCFTDQYFKIRR